VKVSTRGTIAKLKKMARLKENAPIKDRLMAVVYQKKRKVYGRIADLLGRSKSFVFESVNRYRAHGIEGLNDKPRGGRPSKLKPHQLNALKDRIQSGPTDKDMVSVFSGTNIKALLATEFGVEYSQSATYALMHRLGFSLVRPRPHHEKNDPAAMAIWKRDTVPAVFEQTKLDFPDKSVEIWFQDEMRFGEKIELAPRWTLKGTQHSQPRQLGFRNSYIYGAVNPASGEHVGLIFSECCTEIMNRHLSLIAQRLGDDRHAILVMDQAGWHEKSKTLIVPTNITILSLPPYSPELNPVERLWKWLKGNFLKNRCISKDDDLSIIGSDVWNMLTDEIVKSICRLSYKPFSNF